MVRTKKHFKPPTPSSSSSDSSSEEDDDDDDDDVLDQQTMAQRGRGKQMIFGRGKQLPPGVGPTPPPPPLQGRGKQLRAPEPTRESDDDESSDGSSSSDDGSGSSDEDDDDDDVPPPPASRGKQLARPIDPGALGRGKQLRAPPPSQQQQQKDEQNTDSSASVYRPAITSTGKQFGRSLGKQLAIQAAAPAMDDDDDSDSSSEEEPYSAPVAVQQRASQGKQLRLPTPPSATADKEESDMEESSSEEDEEEEEAKEVKPPPPPSAAKKATLPPKRPDKKTTKKRSVPEKDSDESEFEPEGKKNKKAPPKRGKGRPPARAAATRAARSAKAAAKKEISSEEEEEEEDEDDESEEEESEDEVSDESSDEEQEWDMETFDTQKLVQGADDKKYLDSLPELERENILAERFEKLKSEADMKKAIRENKRKEREKKKPAGAKKKPATKRSAPARGKKVPPAKRKRAVRKKSEIESDEEDDDDDEEEEAPDTSADVLLAQSLSGKRASTRNLDKKGNHLKKQAALARIRESRASKQMAVEGESESDLDYGRDSDDSDDDYEESTMLKPWQQQKGKKKQQSESSDDESMGADEDQQTPKGSIEKRTEDTEAVLEDYYKVTIPRRRIMRWCNEPFFEKAVNNFYVRLGIGRENMTQKPCYRLCRIDGVVIKSEYSFPPDLNQKPISTNKWLKVSFGKTVREFKMLTVSDHRPSSDDVNKLVSQLKMERLTDSLLTKKSANKLRKRQDELVINYTYTKEEFDNLVTENKKRSNKASNIGLEKTRIALLVQAANEEVENAKKRLEDAEVERMEADDDDDMATAAGSNVKKAKDELDMANKKLAERIEEQKRIQKEEEDRTSRLEKSSKVQNWVKVNQRAKLANKNADFESYKEQLAREKIQGSSEPKFDPYARRSMKPKNLWEVGGPKQSNDTVGSSSIIEEEKKEATERDDANVGKDGDREHKRDDIPEPHKMELLGQANQFAYDDDIVIGGDISNMGGIGAKKVRARARKGLSLEEYQERKAAGTL